MASARRQAPAAARGRGESARDDASALGCGRSLRTARVSTRGTRETVRRAGRSRTERRSNGSGSIETRASFGDVQLHLEWAAPAKVEGASQGRGNSGVFLMALRGAGARFERERHVPRRPGRRALRTDSAARERLARAASGRATTSSSTRRVSKATCSSSPHARPCCTTACASTTIAPSSEPRPTAPSRRTRPTPRPARSAAGPRQSRAIP